jgi:serine/threonine-protein kinase
MVGEPKPGDVLRGKYRVERVLGSGGMGTVLLATHLKMAQQVAVKVLLPDARKVQDVVARFAREARAASKLKSEHAVRILDVDENEAGEPFFVMEYLEGKDLHALVERDGALPVEQAITYVLQACEGLAEAHAAGIVHRDLKPANLFLTKRTDGSPLVKILDFGISKAVEVEAPGTELVTAPETVMGSPSYMSPEQLRNAATVDARTDIWALGIVLHQLLTGALPFAATGIAALAARIAADPPARVRDKRADIPEELEDVILKCLEKDPSARFADVAELARALAPFAPAGSAGAQRVARTAEARRAAKTAEPTPTTRASSSSNAETISEEPAGLATASLHDVPKERSPLASALSTEYASTVGHASAAPPAQKKRATLATIGIAAIVVGVGVAAAIKLAPSSNDAASVGQPSSALGTSLPAATASTASDKPIIVADVASSAPSAKAISRGDAGADPAKRPPPAAPVERTPKRNPMELDFK